MPAQKSSAHKHGQNRPPYLVASMTQSHKRAQASSHTHPIPASKNSVQARGLGSSPKSCDQASNQEISSNNSDSEDDPEVASRSSSMGSAGVVKLARIQWCKPAFYFHLPHTKYPPNVIQLLRKLEKASRNYTTALDKEQQSEIEDAYPQYDFSPTLYTSRTRKRTCIMDRDLCNHARDLHTEAMERHNDGESNWHIIVRKALGSQGHKGDKKLECTLVDRLVIDNIFLPLNQKTGLPAAGVKVDLAWGYELDQDPFRAPLFRLRHMEQPTLGIFVSRPDRLVAVPVEVKSNAGDGALAEYQISVTAGALLESRHRWAVWRGHPFDYVNDPPLVVALTVVEHVWSFYIIYIGEPNTDPMTGEPYARSEGYSGSDRKSENCSGLNLENPEVDRASEGGHDSARELGLGSELDTEDELPKIVIGPIVAGDTSTLPRTFALVKFLDTLREWVQTEWADGILAELHAPQ